MGFTKVVHPHRYGSANDLCDAIVRAMILGRVLAERVLAEFGGDLHRYATAKARKELRSDQPDHAAVRQEEDSHGPERAQRRAPRHPGTAGLLSP